MKNKSLQRPSFRLKRKREIPWRIDPFNRIAASWERKRCTGAGHQNCSASRKEGAGVDDSVGIPTSLLKS